MIVIRARESEPGSTEFLFTQEVHARVRKLVNERCERGSSIVLPQAAFRELSFSMDPTRRVSSIEFVSLPETLGLCQKKLALPYGEYAEHDQKQNRAQRLQLFASLLEIGLFRPRPKGAAKHFFGIFFINKKEKAETPDPGCSSCELVIRVPVQRQSLLRKCRVQHWAG